MSNQNKTVGKMSGSKRSFEKVVADVRHAVFAVIRQRPAPQGGFHGSGLGSGFFVSRTVFVTCAHVLMNPANPHQDGDTYVLVNSALTGGTSIVQVQNAVTGTNVHIFPDADLALLILDDKQDRAYLPLEYANTLIGSEIGVAGYPVPQFNVVNGTLAFDGLVFRVAKNVLTATYTLATINTNTGVVLTNIPVLEVNFLFVSGNSGGPVFAADTGRVLGFVHGYRSQKIQETVETVSLITTPLPQGVSSTYIHNQTALYSLGIALGRVRTHLEAHGVTL